MIEYYTQVFEQHDDGFWVGETDIEGETLWYPFVGDSLERFCGDNIDWDDFCLKGEYFDAQYP